ncbi:C-GCAxxG-C-C family (seleno)protein [Clostridium sp. ZS2-4]|uniref:C-GCAxxG-C-C family (seleno)protein n=1 Tax=Clostridium sp. ZS2-4 TaxID=2987703 RepID=UPI00227AE89C|nr:C-GCAxxG-C-C family (seleno)protein [Clostridium sp. ZS2-4]MCY6355599.1 C-GCAxxG-C-C family protein [Clostridium sp. ZS2-4]
MSKAVEFYKEGYNCAESIIKALNEEKNLNIPVSVATPFGGGMAVGSTCGAITGAMIAVGAIKGRDSAEESNQVRTISKEVMNKIKEDYGTFNCIELKKNGVSCTEIIEYTYEILKKHI